MWVWNRIKGQEDMATDRQLRLDELRREASIITLDHSRAALVPRDQLWIRSDSERFPAVNLIPPVPESSGRTRCQSPETGRSRTEETGS